MIDKLVAGVDFSGAKTVPNETWLALAHVGNLGVEITEISKVGSHALAQALVCRAGLANLGIDCPFSLPAEFISYLATKKVRPDYQSWQEVAQDLAFMSFDDFMEAVKDFKKEPKRFTDRLAPAPAQSPLHRGNPSMVQMTYYGMRLLSMLDPKHYYILPFQDTIPFGCAVIEVYPRAILKALDLPDSGYKSQDKQEQERVQSARSRIVQGLLSLRERKGITYQKFPRLNVPKRWMNIAIESDHALDALLACYAAAIFHVEPTLYADPLASDNLDVLLEGWIYTPQHGYPLKPPN